MLVWLALPFYDFCGFRSVAVNSVYKLQFFTFSLIISGDARAFVARGKRLFSPPHPIANIVTITMTVTCVKLWTVGTVG